VKLSNQRLSMPPDHPLAPELFYLIGLENIIINKSNDEVALVNSGGDRTSFDRLDAAMALVCKQIELLSQKYREERDADESCRVCLTYDARRLPIVKGHPCLTVVH
jgi:hypothetical protein